MKDMLYELTSNATSDVVYSVDVRLFSIDKHLKLDENAAIFVWNTCFVNLPHETVDLLPAMSPPSRNLL